MDNDNNITCDSNQDQSNTCLLYTSSEFTLSAKDTHPTDDQYKDQNAQHNDCLLYTSFIN